MREHLPVLQVIVPLLAAPLCLVLRVPAVARVLVAVASWTSLTIAGSLLLQVRASGTISYALGGWAAPYGIEYRIDLLSAYLLVLVNVIGAVVFTFLPGQPASKISNRRETHFYAALLLALAGLLGIVATGDAFNIFVFLEISSLAAYSLVALGKRRRALMAAYSYLIIGTIGGTFILLGIGFMYSMTGTLNLAELGEALPTLTDTRTVRVAFAFLFVGVSIKLALFPLHQWLPNAYSEAPAAVSAFLAATSTKVSYYLLVRVVFTLFGAAFVFDSLHLDRLLIPLSIAAMFSGSVAAIYQTNVKRLLAYSSVAQIGYMTLGLSFASVTGLTGGLVHLFNHAMMKGGLFLSVACIAARTGSARLEDFRGLGRRMPFSMISFVVGGLALIGIPGTVGFISKWYLVRAALEQGRFIVAFLIVASSLLAVAYVWRVLEVAYFHPRADDDPEVSEVSWKMLVPTWVLIGATVYFGLSSDLTVGIAAATARDLLEGLPMVGGAP